MRTRTLTAFLAALAVVGATTPVRALGRPGHPFGPEFVPDGHRLAELLSLSDQQKGQLKAMREKDREANRPLIDSARQAHEAFREALEAENLNPTTVGEAAIAMHATEKQLATARQAAFEQMKSILTPEQREKLDEAGPRVKRFHIPPPFDDQP